MFGKGMEPKKGYDLKKWNENFVKITWKVKSSPKKCKCTTCKCKKATEKGEKPTTSPK